MAQVIYSDGAVEDLSRLDDFAGGAIGLIAGAVEMLEAHPYVGREVERGLRELVISRGRTGNVALYHFDEESETVVVLGLRHQHELRY